MRRQAGIFRPNIYGSIYLCKGQSSTLAVNQEGAFVSYNNHPNQAHYISQQSGSGDSQEIHFDAGYSNSKFGTSSDVQIPAVRALVAIRY